MKKRFLAAFKAIWWFVVVPTYAGCVALPVRSNQTCLVVVLIIKAIFVRPWKMVSVSVHYLFHQPMDEKTKTWTLCFPAKENPNMERTLFDWPIVLQYDIKVKYRLISRKFSGMKFFHPSIRFIPTKSHARLYPFDKPITLFPFDCRLCFVCAFLFWGQTKIALIITTFYIARVP